MFHVIRDVVDADTLASLRDELSRGQYVDGRRSASGMAQAVKNNLQLENSKHPQLVQRLTQAILRCAPFQELALPHRMTPLRIGRYDTGMEYGFHSDNPRIDGVRTDLSYTLFLAEPESYSGGELAMITAAGEELRVKLPAGQMVLYPSGALHRVMPVESGARLVAVSWVQSLIRDPRQREIVSDLERMRREYLVRVGHDEHADLLKKVSSNLQRLWAET